MIYLLLFLLTPLAFAGAFDDALVLFDRVANESGMEVQVIGCASSGPFRDPDRCVNPAESICRKGVNPGILASKALYDQLTHLRLEAENGGEVAQYLASKGVKNCFELMLSKNDIAAYALCNRKADASIRPNLVNDDLRAKIQSEFDESKAWISDYIRASILPRVSAAEREDWQKALGRIERLKPVLPDEGEDGLSRGSYIQGDQIFLGKTALLAASSPDQLRFTLLHEISHTTNLSYAFSRSGPMKGLQDCLSSPRGLAAKKADPGCLRKAVSSFQKKYPKEAAKLAKDAERIQIFPNLPWNLDFWPSGEAMTCQNSQHDEAEADFLATQVFAQHRLASASNPAEREAAAVSFVAGRCENQIDLEKYGGGHSGLDEHPSEENRINKLIFAHPDLRAAIGCGTGFGDSLAPRYCGGSLK